MEGGKSWLSEFFPTDQLGEKFAIKRTESDLNPRESENEAMSNSLEREIVATPPLRQRSPMNVGHSGLIHNTISEIGEEKNTNKIPERKKGRVAGYMCNRMFMQIYLSRFSTHAVSEVVKRLNDEQWEAVVKMGFGSMRELRTCSLPYDIFSWMTD
ncbi:hypothetical protein M9H77_04760 [Catharanthus roseus]|uniref:Uncharacterized protein n=1 Tax=Catharanthus roseus TaxID=4058 RepID=A0ACC0CFC0_CATRO|nr:hypothetical protein M9H77_04760 [Catharanthus roseus]